VTIAERETKLHGHSVRYRQAGDGQLLVLIHGITSSSETWREVMPRLAERYTVVAPDLFGHGRSAKPRGDYSLGAYASGIRDLLGVLGFERGTAIGHSLGGGVALQFAYQFPEFCERLVVVSSGGLGKEVHPLLRAASLPGSELVLPLLAREWIVRGGQAVGAFLGRIGVETGPDLAEVGNGYASLIDADARRAFIHTARAVIDYEGQRVSALDRVYLAAEMPTLIVWGTKDRIIPIEHGRQARDQIPNARLVEVQGAGHWPQLHDPAGFVGAVTSFVETTRPFDYSLETMRELLRAGPG
jgi:pimeloyl-ACP methyl ester carboxylesterase